MCFSAEADFASGAVIGVIGVATLTKVARPREIPLAVLPLAFALHQFVEGFVWKDLDDGSSRATGAAVVLYVVFAWILLPVLVPIAIMLLEPAGPVRRRIGALAVVGAVASVMLAPSVIDGSVSARAVEHTIQYGGAGGLGVGGDDLLRDRDLWCAVALGLPRDRLVRRGERGRGVRPSWSSSPRGSPRSGACGPRWSAC